MNIAKKDFNFLEKYEFYQEIQKLPYVEKIILFGSRARKDNQERSDIDLAIVCPQATYDEWVELLDIIDEADTLLKIDCVRFDTLRETSLLKEQILKEGVELYAKNAIKYA